MEGGSVVRFWKMAREHGLNVCIDGGWAVDAALGHQSRPHGDLDIALPASEVPLLRNLLGDRGFVEVLRPDSWQHNFVLQDAAGNLIDVHSYILQPDGSNKGGVPYIADHLCGEGVILGTRVRCVPPKWLVEFHTGYTVDQTDWHDVRLLCARFGIKVPEDYRRFSDGVFGA